LSATDYRKFGLEDGGKALRIELENSTGGIPGEKKGGGKATLLIGNPVEKKAAPAKDEKKDEAKPQPEQYYARLVGEQAVVRVSGRGLKTIHELLDEDGQRLRSLKLTQMLPTSPDAIDIQNAHGLIQLRRGKDFTGEWQFRSPSVGVRKAQRQAVQNLL